MSTMPTDTEGLKIQVRIGDGGDETLWRSPALSEISEPQYTLHNTQSRPAHEPTQEAILIDEGESRCDRNSVYVSKHVSTPPSFMLPSSAMTTAFGSYSEPSTHPCPPLHDFPQIDFGYRYPYAAEPLAFPSNDQFYHGPMPPRHYAYVDNRERALATLHEFEGYFGTMVNNIYAWKELCMLSGMPPSTIPSSIGQCKDFLKTVYINIFDLVEARREERLAKPVFSSATELRLYSQAAGKICPANVDGKRGKGMSSPLWRFCLKRWY